MGFLAPIALGLYYFQSPFHRSLCATLLNVAPCLNLSISFSSERLPSGQFQELCRLPFNLLFIGAVKFLSFLSRILTFFQSPFHRSINESEIIKRIEDIAFNLLFIGALDLEKLEELIKADFQSPFHRSSHVFYWSHCICCNLSISFSSEPQR